MALESNRTDGVDTVKALDVNQFKDLLTGVMTDQPVTLADGLTVSGGTGATLTTAGQLAVGGLTVSAGSGPYTSAAGILPGEQVTAVNPYHGKAYGVRSDGQFTTDGVMNGTTGVLTSASALFRATDVGKLCEVCGAGTAAARLFTTIASYQSTTQVTLAAVSATAVAAARVSWGTDDSAAWVALYAAAPTGAQVIIPKGYSFYQGNFMGGITKSLDLEGLGVFELFQTSDYATSAPTVSPYLGGSVLVQCSAATDGLRISGTAIAVHRRNFGIKFLDGIAFFNTGHGINSAASASDGAGGHTLGEYGSRIDSVFVFGHDGNHYAQRMLNSLNCLRMHLHSYGGGVESDECDSGVTFTGNYTDIGSYGVVFAGGSANVFNIAGIAGHPVNVAVYHRPQGMCYSLKTAYPQSTITDPTGAQYMWKTTHGNISLISIYDPDLEAPSFANPVDFGAANDSVFVFIGAASLPGGTTMPNLTFKAQTFDTPSAEKLYIGKTLANALDLMNGSLVADGFGNWTFGFGNVVVTHASGTGASGLRVPHGTAPTSPVDGDMWTTTAGLLVRINGVTKTVTLT